ncbi:MAG: tyrosine-protein phosphatase [Thermomicrobiales bacterium]
MSRSRHLELEGAANFRDLGGLETTDGRCIRHGRLFRSDALYRLTAADLETLDAFGINTVIDLRAKDEIRRNGTGPLSTTGIRHINFPITDIDSPTDAELTMVEVYLGLMQAAAAGFRDLFQTLAKPDSLPAIVHCMAGKDRTGVAMALILATLGVPDDAIVLDYALSEANLVPLLQLGRGADVDMSTLDIPSSWLEAKPESMQNLLRAISQRWGSVSGYLSGIGVPESTRNQLRTLLLES